MQPFLSQLKRRSTTIGSIRSYFDELNFIEVDTPIAITAPAPELHIEAPRVDLCIHGRHQTRYLQASPELAMKRLLAQGADKIYQIAPVFRNGDHSKQHRPEFRLLEWYRQGAEWSTLLDDCEDLFRRIAKDLNQGESLDYQGQTIDLSGPFDRITVEEAFVQHAGFSILGALNPTKLRNNLDLLSIHHNPADDWSDLFHRVFLARVEPELLRSTKPFFLTQYPAPLCSLAQLSPDDARIAQRVELYIGGMELANGFGELTCSKQQRSRFENTRNKRIAMGGADYPFDEAFLQCLDLLAPSAGMALGVDRLLMLVLDLPSIEQSACLPWDES